VHRGVQALVGWIDTHNGKAGVTLRPPAAAAHLAALEDMLLSPMPSDLRMLLGRHDGGRLPNGVLLSASPAAQGDSILETRADLATRLGKKPDDPELPLPFYRSDEGAVLVFDRSAGPVPDTWPIADYHLETRETRIVHRTLDGFCSYCVADWTDSDFNAPFSLDKYLKAGLRHAKMEPDVSASHATAAHALRRAGRPKDALASYLRAARCLPALAYADWEALKLAVLLGDVPAALEAGTRVSSRAPRARWRSRETKPLRVAQALSWLAEEKEHRDTIMRLLDQLAAQADPADVPAIHAVRKAMFTESPMPETLATRATAVPVDPNAKKRWALLEEAYREGRVRDEDLLLDPAYGGREADPPLHLLLAIRREF
jgi:hypothetical protein